MNLLREKLRACGQHRAMGGGGGGSSIGLSTTNVTQNTDRRSVLSDAVSVGDGSASTISTNSTNYTWAADAAVLDTLAQTLPDSVNTLAQMGATTLRDVGGAVVDLNRDSQAQNARTWDATLQYGSGVVEKLLEGMQAGYGLADKAISTGNALAGKAVDSFTPTENKNADIGKYAMWAAAAVAAAVLLKGSK